jgi:hypothetical protein
MTYGNIVSDNCFCLLISAMDNASILNIHFISDPDTVHISTYHGVEPDTAIVSYYHITYDSSIGGYIYIFSKSGRNAFNRKNDRHDLLFV